MSLAPLCASPDPVPCQRIQQCLLELHCLLANGCFCFLLSRMHLHRARFTLEGEMRVMKYEVIYPRKSAWRRKNQWSLWSRQWESLCLSVRMTGSRRSGWMPWMESSPSSNVHREEQAGSYIPPGCSSWPHRDRVIFNRVGSMVLTLTSGTIKKQARFKLWSILSWNHSSNGITQMLLALCFQQSLLFGVYVSGKSNIWWIFSKAQPQMGPWWTHQEYRMNIHWSVSPKHRWSLMSLIRLNVERQKQILKVFFSITCSQMLHEWGLVFSVGGEPSHQVLLCAGIDGDCTGWTEHWVLPCLRTESEIWFYQAASYPHI